LCVKLFKIEKITFTEKNAANCRSNLIY